MAPKKTVREKWPRERARSSPPGFRTALFFLAVFFRVTHDGLCERGTTRSLASCIITFFSEETPFLTPAEKLFKLYDGVETFVLFIGYPRSRSSLVSAILDAHPEIVMSHECSVLENWKNTKN